MTGLWRRGVVLLLLLGLVAVARWGMDRQPAFDAVLTPRATVQLYFSDADAQYLVPEARTLPAAALNPLRLLEELGRGPQDPGLRPTIPRGARPRAVVVADGIAFVDYSAELRTRHPGGSTGEILTVYSIVATLTQLPGIDAVQLLLEGEAMDSLVGHLDLSRPLLPDPRFIAAP
ncbi:MAG TPA: GerMN domain-containing protein [Limnochordales bacterium]|nr:GerMN domain-containing protein [Limnochordales bacterium]